MKSIEIVIVKEIKKGKKLCPRSCMHKNSKMLKNSTFIDFPFMKIKYEHFKLPSSFVLHLVLSLSLTASADITTTGARLVLAAPTTPKRLPGVVTAVSVSPNNHSSYGATTATISNKRENKNTRQI